MCAVDLTDVYSPALFIERSMQLGLSTGMAAELETGWNLETKSRRDKCSSELRLARPKVLIARPPFPLFLKLQNSIIGKLNQVESTENTGITARSHLIFAVRECFEQMHGDHFIFEHPFGNKPYIQPCGSLGVAWTAEEEAKSVRKNETALPKEEVEADSIGNAMFTVNNVGKIQDSCDL